MQEFLIPQITSHNKFLDIQLKIEINIPQSKIINFTTPENLDLNLIKKK